jgi:hypothetical protein
MTEAIHRSLLSTGAKMDSDSEGPSRPRRRNQTGKASVSDPVNVPSRKVKCKKDGGWTENAPVSFPVHCWTTGTTPAAPTGQPFWLKCPPSTNRSGHYP